MREKKNGTIVGGGVLRKEHGQIVGGGVLQRRPTLAAKARKLVGPEAAEMEAAQTAAADAVEATMRYLKDNAGAVPLADMAELRGALEAKYPGIELFDDDDPANAKQSASTALSRAAKLAKRVEWHPAAETVAKELEEDARATYKRVAGAMDGGGPPAASRTRRGSGVGGNGAAVGGERRKRSPPASAAPAAVGGAGTGGDGDEEDGGLVAEGLGQPAAKRQRRGSAAAFGSMGHVADGGMLANPPAAPAAARGTVTAAACGDDDEGATDNHEKEEEKIREGEEGRLDGAVTAADHSAPPSIGAATSGVGTVAVLANRTFAAFVQQLAQQRSPRLDAITEAKLEEARTHAGVLAALAQRRKRGDAGVAALEVREAKRHASTVSQLERLADRLRLAQMARQSPAPAAVGGRQSPAIRMSRVMMPTHSAREEREWERERAIRSALTELGNEQLAHLCEKRTATTEGSATGGGSGGWGAL